MEKSQRLKLKQQLLEEKQKLWERLRENQHFGLFEGMNDSVGELSGYDNHPADLGTEMFERGKDLALNDAEVRRFQAIERALDRIEKGEYGKCVTCHEEIAYERLAAIPWTEYCVKHQPEAIPSVRRPIEESVLGHPEHAFADAYDGGEAWREVEQYGTSHTLDKNGS